MGWGRMMLLGNLGQQLDINDLGNAINEMQSAITGTQDLDRTQESTIEALKNENHELKLYLATLVRLLVSKGIIKQEEVDTAVLTIDKT